MANQMIALQTRNPQLPDPSKMTAQYATLMNMAQQNETSKRQAAQAQQQMDFAAAKEGREKDMQPFSLGKAKNEAFSAQQKAVLDFMDLSYETIKRARTPEDVINGAGRLKQNFPDPVFADLIDQTVASLPADPSQFSAWKQQSEIDTLSNVQRLEQTYKTQTTGTEQREIAMPKYGGGGATEVPGSRFQVAEGMNYIRDANGATYAMPTKSGGSFGTPAPAGSPGKGSAKPGQYGAAIESAVMQLAPGTTVSGRGRTQQRNAEVGGISNSYHLSDNARDLQPAKGQSLDQLAASLAPLKQQGFDVVIERRKNHVHVEPGPGMPRGGASNAAPGGPTPILPGKAPAPDKSAITPETKLARDTAVQNLFDAIEAAQKKGHLVSEKQSFVANRATELQQGRAYAPGGTAQKTSIDNIDAAATQLLRQFIQKGTSGTLNTKVEQENFLKSVGGGNATYETRLQTVRNFAKQNGIKLNEAGTAKPKAAPPKRATPTKSSIPEDIAKMYGL